MTQYAAPIKFNAFLARIRIALWLARRARAYSIVSDDEFVDFCLELNPLATLPSRHTVSRDVQLIHKMTKAALIKRLGQSKSRVHVIVDGWTSPNTISYLGVVIQHVVDGAIETRYLDYVR